MQIISRLSRLSRLRVERLSRLRFFYRLTSLNHLSFFFNISVQISINKFQINLQIISCQRSKKKKKTTHHNVIPFDFDLFLPQKFSLIKLRNRTFRSYSYVSLRFVSLRYVTLRYGNSNSNFFYNETFPVQPNISKLGKVVRLGKHTKKGEILHKI